MADRLYLTVTDTESGEIIFDEQLLGNYQCFNEDTLKKLGVVCDNAGHFGDTKIGSIQDVLEALKAYLVEYVSLNSGNLNLPKTFLDMPEWTTVGNYAIMHYTLSKIVDTPNTTIIMSYT